MNAQSPIANEPFFFDLLGPKTMKFDVTLEVKSFFRLKTVEVDYS